MDTLTIEHAIRSSEQSNKSAIRSRSSRASYHACALSFLLLLILLESTGCVVGIALFTPLPPELEEIGVTKGHGLYEKTELYDVMSTRYFLTVATR